MAAPCCRTVPLRLLLVRHGLSSFNKERRIQGRDDLSNLSEEGHEQARRLGRSLAEVPIDAIYSSPLRRAASTTTSLLEGRNAAAPEPVFDDGLLEVDLNPWSGLLIDELKQRFPEPYDTWKRRPMELELTHSDGRSYSPLGELAAGTLFLDTLLERHALTETTPCSSWRTTRSSVARCS